MFLEHWRAVQTFTSVHMCISYTGGFCYDLLLLCSRIGSEYHFNPSLVCMCFKFL